MSWAMVRSAIASRLNGQTLTVSGFSAETLLFLEWPPSGEIGPDMLPIGFIVPPARSVRWIPNSQRVTDLEDIELRFYLGPGAAPGTEEMAKRADGWVEKVIERFDGFQKFGGSVDATLQGLSVTDVAQFLGAEDRPVAWGFRVTVGVHLTETKTLGA